MSAGERLPDELFDGIEPAGRPAPAPVIEPGPSETRLRLRALGRALDADHERVARWAVLLAFVGCLLGLCITLAAAVGAWLGWLVGFLVTGIVGRNLARRWVRVLELRAKEREATAKVERLPGAAWPPPGR